MTERGKMLLGAVRRNIELLTELDKTAPRDVEEILAAFVAHVRTWKPAMLHTLDTGPFGKVEP